MEVAKDVLRWIAMLFGFITDYVCLLRCQLAGAVAVVAWHCGGAWLRLGSSLFVFPGAS